MAAWYTLEGNEIYQALALGRSIPSDRLKVASIGLIRATDWVPSGDRYYMLASAEWERCRNLPLADPSRSEGLARVARDLRQGLSANPADGRASLMLAVVRAWQGAPARQVAEALLHSMDMAPNMEALWLWRTTYFFAVRSALTADEAASVRGQLRAIWRYAPTLRLSLVQSAIAAGQADELSLALADEPYGLAEFEQLKVFNSLR